VSSGLVDVDTGGDAGGAHPSSWRYVEDGTTDVDHHRQGTSQVKNQTWQQRGWGLSEEECCCEQKGDSGDGVEMGRAGSDERVERESAAPLEQESVGIPDHRDTQTVILDRQPSPARTPPSSDFDHAFL